MTETKMTPKQIVLEVYHQAKSGREDNGNYVVFIAEKILGRGVNANMAWKSASENIRSKNVKLSKRRQRILNKIEAGEYFQKTPEQSLNISFRRFR